MLIKCNNSDMTSVFWRQHDVNILVTNEKQKNIYIFNSIQYDLLNLKWK